MKQIFFHFLYILYRLARPDLSSKTLDETQFGNETTLSGNHLRLFKDANATTRFQYIGSLGAELFQPRDYYITTVPATWNDAEQDCERVFKSSYVDGSLISFETPEELKNVRKMLETYGAGKRYWTSGMYVGAGDWTWASSEEQVSPFALPSQLDIKPTYNDRLVLEYQNRFVSNFDVGQNTQPHRYICEKIRSSENIPSTESPQQSTTTKITTTTTTPTTTTTTTPRPTTQQTTTPNPNICSTFSNSPTACMNNHLDCRFCAEQLFYGDRCITTDTISKTCGGEQEQCGSNGKPIGPRITLNRNPSQVEIPSTDYMPFCIGTTRIVDINWEIPNSRTLSMQKMHHSGIEANGRLEFQFFSMCNSPYGPLVETNKCSSVWPYGKASFVV